MSTLKVSKPALVNLTGAKWTPNRLKRNISIFTHLLKTGRFSRGYYIHLGHEHSTGLSQYLPITQTTQVDKEDCCPIEVINIIGALPFTYRSSLSCFITGRMLGAAIQNRIGLDFVLWLNTISRIECAIAEYLARHSSRTVFDSSDDLPTLERADSVIESETRLNRMLHLSTDVVCVNEQIFTKLPHPRKHLFKNCTAFSQLSERHSELVIRPWIPKQPGTVYIGFVGTLHEDRVDQELLKYLFRRFESYHFLFVGWVSPSLEPILRAPNVHFIPEVPHWMLGDIIRSFDVGIIPHADNRHTRGNDLLKMLDYNACAIPVVATPVSGLNPKDSVGLLAADFSTFGDSIDLCISGKHRLDLERGRELAKARSWELQVPKLLSMLSLFPESGGCTG